MEEVDLPKLAELNLGKNRLTAMPPVTRLRSLSKLVLSDNQVCDNDSFFQ